MAAMKGKWYLGFCVKRILDWRKTKKIFWPIVAEIIFYNDCICNSFNTLKLNGMNEEYYLINYSKVVFGNSTRNMHSNIMHFVKCIFSKNWVRYYDETFTER